MNLKTTLVLVVLGGGCAALFWKGAEWLPKVGLAPPPTPPVQSATADALAALKPDAVTRIVVRAPGNAPVELDRPDKGGPLALAGSWPVRELERDELVRSVCGLASRFVPAPADHPSGYGLADDQNPIRVEVTAAGTTVNFLFGEPPAKAGENPFTRPAYVMLDGGKDVLRLGPDVLPVLRRPAEAYRKRQIVPETDKLHVAEGSAGADGERAAPRVPLLGSRVKSVVVEGAAGRYVLRRVGPMPAEKPLGDKPGSDVGVLPNRLADAWEIVEPVTDRAEPGKLKSALAAAADLWVDRFVVNEDALAGLVGGPAFAAVAERVPPPPAGRKLVVEFDDGSKRTVLFGKVSRRTTKTETPPPPPFPGAAATAQGSRRGVRLRQAGRQPARVRGEGRQVQGPVPRQGRLARRGAAAAGRGPAGRRSTPRPERPAHRGRSSRVGRDRRPRADDQAGKDQGGQEGRCRGWPEGPVGHRRPLPRAGRGQADHRLVESSRKHGRQEGRHPRPAASARPGRRRRLPRPALPRPDAREGPADHGRVRQEGRGADADAARRQARRAAQEGRRHDRGPRPHRIRTG